MSMRIKYDQKVAVLYLDQDAKDHSEAYYICLHHCIESAIADVKSILNNNPHTKGSYILSFYDNESDMFTYDFLMISIESGSILMKPCPWTI